MRPPDVRSKLDTEQGGLGHSENVLNFVRLNFSGGSIPSILGVKGNWYLERSCSFGADLVVLASDLVGRIGFVVIAALATSLARKSPSPRFRLALRVW